MVIQARDFTVRFMKPTKKFWLLQFNISPQFCSTSQFPQLSNDLRVLLPEIMVAQCDNAKDLPFCEELKETQTAHLFEHMVLEYLCKLRLRCGFGEASYEGRTFWDTLIATGENSLIAISRHGESKQEFAEAVTLSQQLLTQLIQNTGVIHAPKHTERGVKPLAVFID
jgi:hypothetical protein